MTYYQMMILLDTVRRHRNKHYLTLANVSRASNATESGYSEFIKNFQ